MYTWKHTLYLMFAAQFLTSIGFSTIIPFLPSYVRDLGSRTDTDILFWIAAVFSVQGLTVMIASPIWGAIADRYGRKLMIQRVLFGGAVVILLMGFVRSAEELVVLRAVQGLITGMVAASNSLVAAAVPRRRMGYAMGAMQTALWGGVAIGPVIGGGLEFLFGYRASFIVTSVLLLLGGLLVTLWVREGFTPDPAAHRAGPRGYLAAWKQVLAAPGVNLAYLLRFGTRLGHNMLMPFLPLFVASIVINQELTGIVTGLAIGSASAAGTASAIYLGHLGDRIGHKPILVGSALVATLLYLPLGLAATSWQFLILNTLVGVALGGLVPSISALLTHYTKRGEEGSVFGLDNAAVAASRLVGPLLGGLVVTLGGLLIGFETYRGLFFTAAIICLATALLANRYLPSTRRVRSNPTAD